MVNSANPRRAGFNLLEVTISSLLVSILLVGSMKTVGALAYRCGIRAQQDIKLTLAHDLLCEMQQVFFEDPDTVTTTLGLDADEAVATREDFDDIDDYHNLTESSLVTKDGSAMPGYAGYKRAVRVQYVDISDPNIVVADATDLKRIVITVTGPDGQSASLATLRGRHSPMDLEPGLSANYVRSVRVRLDLEGSSSSLTSGSGILNQIAVEAPL